MTGYFSRIIQQTGIHVGSGGDFKSGGPEPSPPRSKQDEGITPLHVEETKLIEPQQGPGIETHTEGGNVEDSAQEKEEGRMKGRTSEEEMLDRHETVESDPPDKHDIQQPVETSVPAVTLKQPVFKPGKAAEDRLDDKAGRKATLREVREWVAGTPAAEFEEILPNKDANETESIGEKEPSESLADGDLSLASHPGAIEYPASAEPEIHDFHLSIGTIRLTIEEPQKEIQGKEPQRIMKERKPTREAQSTRLTRHYIRI